MLTTLIILIIIGIFLGLFLGAVLAPLVMYGNKKKLDEMRAVVEEYRTNGGDRDQVKQKLVTIKAGMSELDKGAVEQARDILSLV